MARLPKQHLSLLTLRVCQHLHAAREHCPQHVVVLGEGADGGVVEGATNIELHIL